MQARARRTRATVRAHARKGEVGREERMAVRDRGRGQPVRTACLMSVIEMAREPISIVPALTHT